MLPEHDALVVQFKSRVDALKREFEAATINADLLKFGNALIAFHLGLARTLDDLQLTKGEEQRGRELVTAIFEPFARTATEEQLFGVAASRVAGVAIAYDWTKQGHRLSDQSPNEDLKAAFEYMGFIERGEIGLEATIESSITRLRKRIKQDGGFVTLNKETCQLEISSTELDLAALPQRRGKPKRKPN